MAAAIAAHCALSRSHRSCCSRSTRARTLTDPVSGFRGPAVSRTARGGRRTRPRSGPSAPGSTPCPRLDDPRSRSPAARIRSATGAASAISGLHAVARPALVWLRAATCSAAPLVEEELGQRRPRDVRGHLLGHLQVAGVDGEVVERHDAAAPESSSTGSRRTGAGPSARPPPRGPCRARPTRAAGTHGHRPHPRLHAVRPEGEGHVAVGDRSRPPDARRRRITTEPSALSRISSATALHRRVAARATTSAVITSASCTGATIRAPGSPRRCRRGARDGRNGRCRPPQAARPAAAPPARASTPGGPPSCATRSTSVTGRSTARSSLRPAVQLAAAARSAANARGEAIAASTRSSPSASRPPTSPRYARTAPPAAILPGRAGDGLAQVAHGVGSRGREPQHRRLNQHRAGGQLGTADDEVEAGSAPELVPAYRRGRRAEHARSARRGRRPARRPWCRRTAQARRCRRTRAGRRRSCERRRRAPRRSRATRCGRSRCRARARPPGRRRARHRRARHRPPRRGRGHFPTGYWRRRTGSRTVRGVIRPLTVADFAAMPGATVRLPFSRPSTAAAATSSERLDREVRSREQLVGDARDVAELGLHRARAQRSDRHPRAVHLGGSTSLKVLTNAFVAE